MDVTADPVADLLARAASGDQRAFGPLYSATSAKLFGVLLRILGDRAEAEDALQDVFTRVWTNAGRYDPSKGRGMTWLITIARNRGIDRLRARATQPEGGGVDPDTVGDGRGGAEEKLLAKANLGQLADCLGRQPPDKASALKGAYISGDSYAALAARFDVPLNTMRTWLRRGLLQLRECMDQ